MSSIGKALALTQVVKDMAEVKSMQLEKKLELIFRQLDELKASKPGASAEPSPDLAAKIDEILKRLDALETRRGPGRPKLEKEANG